VRRVFLSALLVGCGAPEPLQIALPIDAADRSAILIVERVGAEGAAEWITAGAADLPASGGPVISALAPRLPEVRDGEQLRAALLTYPQPLADLGLAAGPLPLSTSPSAPPPPREQRAHSIQIDFDSDPRAVWSLDRPRAAWIERTRLDLPACADLQPQVTPIPVPAEVTFAQRTVSRVVLGLGDGDMLNFGADLFFVQTSEYGTADALLTAVPASDGAYWFSARDGRIVRALLGATGTDQDVDVARAPSGGALAWMDGVFERDRVDELFTLSTQGAVERLAGDRWSQVALEGRPVDLGGVVRLGPGEALIATGAPELLHVRGEALFRPRPAASGSPITALAAIPDFAVLAGTADGEVLRRVGEDWVSLGRAAVEGRIASLLPFGGGFVAGTTRGELAPYVRGSGFCATLQATTATLSRGVAYDGALYVSGPPPAGSTSPVLVVLGPR
jgi:hypothetical protein